MPATVLHAWCALLDERLLAVAMRRAYRGEWVRAAFERHLLCFRLSEMYACACFCFCSMPGYFMPDNRGGSNFSLPAQYGSCQACPVRDSHSPACIRVLRCIYPVATVIQWQRCCVMQVNSYQPMAGQASCLLCPAGFSTQDVGNTACEPCSLGFFSASAGASRSIISLSYSWQENVLPCQASSLTLALLQALYAYLHQREHLST